jgi:hypothetical protein
MDEFTVFSLMGFVWFISHSLSDDSILLIMGLDRNEIVGGE